MDWKSPFIVYRISADGKLSEVFHANDLKGAGYWLTYIAEPGDVLCRTPAHPRHEGGTPVYWSHKEQSGTPVSNEDSWKKSIEQKEAPINFPIAQQVDPSS